LTFYVDFEYLVLVEKIEIGRSLLLSRCETAYHSRAPPSCPPMA
jgi:hypothetical protein